MLSLAHAYAYAARALLFLTRTASALAREHKTNDHKRTVSLDSPPTPSASLRP